jgi:hypothetical protein
MADMSEIDDTTATYVLEHSKHFEDLRHVTGQLAGLLVLAATGATLAVPDHPLLETAEQLLRDAVKGFRGARVTIRARQHHQCVLHAASALRRALDAARARPGHPGGHRDLDPILTPLRAGYAHLQRAADSLPGFEMIAFDRGCCARSESSLSCSADRGPER